MATTGAPKWVRLYLVPQTDQANTMPPYVTGLLTGEVAGGYVLNPMMEVQPPKDEAEGYDTTLEQVGMNIISKTYVWRCQILEDKPDAEIEKSNAEANGGESGGLG